MTRRRIRSAAANHAAGVLVFLGMIPIPLYAAHPLITDDTGTQGKGGFQLELTTGRGHEHEDGTTVDAVESRATLSYGFHDRADAFVTVSFSSPPSTPIPGRHTCTPDT